MKQLESARNSCGRHREPQKSSALAKGGRREAVTIQIALYGVPSTPEIQSYVCNGCSGLHYTLPRVLLSRNDIQGILV